MIPQNTGPQRFPSTRWSLVLQSSDADGTTRKKALSELCEIYWPPVYAFIRRKGHSPHDAEDLTQGFFARILEREDLAAADSAKGRLRSYLMTAITRHMSHERQREQAQKRGGDRVILSLNEASARTQVPFDVPAEDQTPAQVFDHQWALTLLRHVFEQLKSQYHERGKQQVFDALQGTLTAAGVERPLTEIAEDLGMSLSNVKVASHRMRQRYAELLRESLRDTLTEGEDVEKELGHLIGAVGSAPA